MVEHLNQLIFFGALLVLVSIFAGLLSNRFGAPLLLVFLGLGMLVGEDGPGGVLFSDYRLAYLVGSTALAIVLFDGGLRTKRESFQLAAWPALILASVGVLVTAVVVAVVAHYATGLGPVESLLVGSIVGSTDAAAVFFLLNLRGMQIQKRVSATLEVESGINDPMAIFLTITCVHILGMGGEVHWQTLPLELLRQMAGGAVVGVAGGYAMVWLLNRLELAAGLYPIFAVAFALALFGGTQSLDSSGYLAVYIAGLILGNRRHRGSQLIGRFHDGLAWLSQIVMFLMLGLLVTPSRLLPDLIPAVIVAGALMLVARPLAVVLCLAPFRFSLRELSFVSWVGLRGAVPIFLATLPVLAGIKGADIYFSIAFVVVLMSLALQGWTIGRAAHLLDLELPAGDGVERAGIDVVGRDIDRDIAAYRAADNSPALGYPFRELPLPRRTRILAVIREGTVMTRDKLERLQPQDLVLCVAPPEQMLSLDRLFAPRPKRAQSETIVFGEFTLAGNSTLGTVADFYCFPVTTAERNLQLADFIAKRLRRRPVVGDRLTLGPIELVVQEMAGNRVTTAGIELEPEEARWARHPLIRRLRRAIGRA
jgi:cell volume regulation protein A